MDPKKLREILNKQPSNKSPNTAETNPNKAESAVRFLQRNRNVFMRKKQSKRLEKRKKVSQDLNTVFPFEVPSNKKRKFNETGDSSVPRNKKNSVSEKPKSHANSSNDLLKGSQFRFLNELLYTQSSEEADQMFKNDPEAFQIYHTGFETQRLQWPKDPLQRVIKFIQHLPKGHVVADFGCGDARLAMTLTEKKVHSFDFMALNERVTACDMRKTPLKPNTVDVAVFCLSLMGTNCNEFIKEANRVLKINGVLMIVELTSRIERLTRIVNQIEKMGFSCLDKAPGNFFIYLTFLKKSACPKGGLPPIIFNPCSYKKR